MKTLVAKIPERLFNEIATEAKIRKVSRSEIIRERLDAVGTKQSTVKEAMGDLIGSSTDGRLPSDLSARKKHYLKKWGYGKKRHC